LALLVVAALLKPVCATAQLGRKVIRHKQSTSVAHIKHTPPALARPLANSNRE
jgi:hypothetical protein